MPLTDLTEEERGEARRQWNSDTALLLVPLSTGRTALFSRHFEFVSVVEWKLPVENLNQIIEDREAQKNRELNDREFAASLRRVRQNEDRVVVPRESHNQALDLEL